MRKGSTSLWNCRDCKAGEGFCTSQILRSLSAISAMQCVGCKCTIFYGKKYWSWAVKVKKIVYYFFPSSWPHFWGQMNCISPFTLYCNLHTYLHNSAKWVSSSRSNLTTWLYTQACGITAGPLFGQNSQKSLANTEWNLNIILNFFIMNRDS